MLIDPSWETARSLLALEYIKVREDVSSEYQVEEERLWIEDTMSWFIVTNAVYIGPLIFVQFTLKLRAVQAPNISISASVTEYPGSGSGRGITAKTASRCNSELPAVPGAYSLLPSIVHSLRLATSEHTSVWQLWALEGVYQSPTGFIEDSSSPWLEFPSGDLWWLV